MFTKNKNRILGFTLIEVMITLILSVMVSFFVYTMVMSSYTAFRRLLSVSKNSNSIRFFVSSIQNSVRNAHEISIDGTSMTFKRFDTNLGVYVTEKYYFSEGGSIVRNSAKSTRYSSLKADTGAALGVLKKEVTVSGTVRERIVVSNVIRTIYYYVPTTGTYQRIHLGVVYDDVIDGKQTSTGKLASKETGGTEIGTNDTLARIILCYCSRGMRF